MGRPISVMAVDGHPIFLEGIARVLGGAAEIRLAGLAASAGQALAGYRRLQPDVLLMDLWMPGLDGIGTIAALRAEFPCARIVVLTSLEGDTHALRALQAGAAAYLSKSMVGEELLRVIRQVHAGRSHIPQRIADAMAQYAPADALSARQVQVLELAAGGCGNRGIAAALGIAEETAKVHMKHAIAKLRARDRTHAVTIALGRGILDPRPRAVRREQ